MAETSTYSIRDLEELSGIPAHTIRTWERRYRLLTPARNACNVRCYHARDVSFLNHLASLLKQGHRISTLAGKSRDEITALAQESAFSTKNSEITETLCQVLQDYDVTKVESLMSCYIRKEGFDNAVSVRFAPFLNQMNLLLLSGALQSVHAQIFSAVLRQKIYVALDAIIPARDAPRWILLHDKDATGTIYADIVHYLLRKAGRQVILAGAMNPTGIQEFIKDAAPDGFCLIAGEEYSDDWLQTMLNALPEDHIKQGNTLILSQGETLNSINNGHLPGLVILNGLQEAFNHLLKA